MERLTSNRNVSEMGMLELAHNSCYRGRDGWARYRDYEIDIDARELVRKLLTDFAEGDDSFTCDENFEEYITACLEDGTDSMEGLIALFYRNLWAMADLRERLKYYEDLEERLQTVYGECDGLLKKVVEHLERHEGIDFPGAVHKARLLTDGEADRWEEFKCLEEQGKLLKLPCAVGDTVWDIDFGRPCSYEVTGFSFGGMNENCVENEMVLDQVLVYWTNSSGSLTGSFAVSEIGKTVFLTREEAETALKEL